MICRDVNIGRALHTRQRGFLLNPFRFGGSGGGSGLTYAQQVAADSPVRYWRLNDTSGSTAVGIGGNGTYVNAHTKDQPGFVNGGKSVFFDPTVDTLNGGGYLETNFGTNFTTSFAVELFFNAHATQLDGAPALISKSEYFAGAIADFPFSLSWGSTGVLSATLSMGNDFTNDATLTVSGLSADTDYHVVVNYRNSGLCEIYLNGEPAASQTITFSVSATSFNWRVAARHENGDGAGDSGFRGRIAEVAIYGAALSSARIAAHYAARSN